MLLTYFHKQNNDQEELEIENEEKRAATMT